MLKGKLYCENNDYCYYATAIQINDLSDKCQLDVEAVTYDDGEKTNMIIDKNSKCLFSSKNPLKIIDFLKGYLCGKKNKM